MKYKRLFLGICLTLLMVISQAQERVLPKFKLGGALRFNYNFCDWKPGHRDRGGDFGFDVLYFKLSGSYRNIILSADYRFYSKDFGGPMLKYGWIGYQFNDKSQMQLGLTGVPFGIQPIASHNFFLQIAYYIGLEDDSDMGIKYLYQGDTWDFTFAFFKNADELLFGSDNETSDDRYGYDVAGRNKEINQINGQAFYKFGYTGIIGIDKEIIEAARGMGSTTFQILYKIQIPLAFPVILSGIRNMVVMTIALTGIAAFIGAGGLGVAIYRGITTNNSAMTIAGSLLIALLALLADWGVGRYEKHIKRKRKLL